MTDKSASMRKLLLVVICMVTVEAAQENFLFHTDGNPLEVNNGLYEGDIVLTPQQEVQMMARRVVNNNAFWWPRNSKGIVNVDYRFGDEFVSKTGVKKAISAWESHTCIRFHELSKPKQSPHLIFVTSNGCASNVGRIYFSRSGQKVWLAPGCFSNPGTPIHEIGHALGFNHEQARSDRDDHVDVVFDNVVPGRERNFQKRNTNNFDVPYDYFSLMHYGSSYFSKNGLSTIVPKNPLAESLLGNRADFSFWDLKLVNLQYRCTKTFLNDCQMAEDPCQNDGYTGPACTCLCPPGTSGSRCETRVGDYTETLVQERFPHSARFTTPGVISSPGFPDNLPTGTGKYIQELKAPECHKVQLVFSEFVLMQRPDSPVPCLYQGLTLRLQDPPIDSNVFCGRDIAPGRVFESAGRTLVLNFVNYYPKTTPSKYRAEFIFIWNTEKCGEQE